MPLLLLSVLDASYQQTGAPGHRCPCPGCHQPTVILGMGSKVPMLQLTCTARGWGWFHGIWEPQFPGHGQHVEEGPSKQGLTVTRLSITSLWLSIIFPTSPSHSMALHHGTLPLLTIFFMSCSPSPLPHPSHEHAQPQQPTLQPGPRGVCGTPRPPPRTLPNGPVLGDGFSCSRLQSPVGATSSPKPQGAKPASFL